MAVIAIPREFFKKERNTVYSNWKFAFWRELFQNSYDAGATCIEIKTEEDGEKTKVRFADNGCGMTRQILDDVYFQLGKSTKEASGQVGGFGRARIVTNFSMLNYSIHTLNNFVFGSGAEYEISSAENFPGTDIEMVMDDYPLKEARVNLVAFMSVADFKNLRVFFNGQPLGVNNAPIGRFLQDLSYGGKPFAKVYSSSALGTDRVIIRVNGCPMYLLPLESKHLVIVEIEPSISRDVLVASRDGMKWNYSNVFNQYYEILKGNSHILKRTWTYEKRRFNGRGTHLSVNRRISGAYDSKVPITTPTGRIKMKLASLINGEHLASRQSSQNGDHLVTADVVTGSSGGYKTKISEFLPDIPIIVDTINEKVKQAAEKFDPNNWEIEIVGNTVDWKGHKPVLKLLLSWTAICQHIVQAAQEEASDFDINWVAGFAFAEDYIASHEHLSDTHHFYIVPVDENGKWKYSLQDRRDLKKLMAAAKHEVSHVMVSSHNESFAKTISLVDSWTDEEQIYQELTEIRKL